MVEIAGLIEYAGYNAPVIFINGGQVACVLSLKMSKNAQAGSLCHSEYRPFIPFSTGCRHLTDGAKASAIRSRGNYYKKRIDRD